MDLVLDIYLFDTSSYGENQFRQFVNVNLWNPVNLQSDWDLTPVNLQIDWNFQTICELTDWNRHFTNCPKISRQFSNWLISQIDANIYMMYSATSLCSLRILLRWPLWQSHNSWCYTNNIHHAYTFVIMYKFQFVSHTLNITSLLIHLKITPFFFFYTHNNRFESLKSVQAQKTCCSELWKRAHRYQIFRSHRRIQH